LLRHLVRQCAKSMGLFQSPRRKAAVIRKLSGSLATEDNTCRSVRNEPTEIENKVIEFYRSDLV